MNLKTELAKLLAVIRDDLTLPGREFKRMMQAVVDKCESAPPQGTTMGMTAIEKMVEFLCEEKNSWEESLNNSKDPINSEYRYLRDNTELYEDEARRLLADERKTIAPQGLIEELEKWVHMNNFGGRINADKNKFEALLSRYKVPATDRVGEECPNCKIRPGGVIKVDDNGNCINCHRPICGIKAGEVPLVKEMRNLYREEVLGSVCESCGAGMWKRFNKILGKKEN